MKAELAQESMKASPPVTITAVAWMSGLTLNEIVALATLAYVVLQAAYLIWKWVREIKAKRG